MQIVFIILSMIFIILVVGILYNSEKMRHQIDEIYEKICEGVDDD